MQEENNNTTTKCLKAAPYGFLKSDADAVTEFRNDKIAIHACVATPCLVTSPPLKLL